MADRFNKVRIGTIHLTKDGTNAGTPCKLSIGNLDLLRMDKTGNFDLTANGSVFIQLVDNHGVELTISVIRMTKAVFDDLKDLLNTSNNAGDQIEVEITGRTGNFTKMCNVHPKQALSARGFFNDWIQNVEIRLITA